MQRINSPTEFRANNTTSAKPIFQAFDFDKDASVYLLRDCPHLRRIRDTENYNIVLIRDVPYDKECHSI